MVFSLIFKTIQFSNIGFYSIRQMSWENVALLLGNYKGYNSKFDLACIAI